MQSTKRLQSPGSALAKVGLSLGTEAVETALAQDFQVIQALKEEESCFLHVLWIYN